MKYVDYYKTLGVERNATEAQIKKAYRNLAHKYHPDVSKEPDAETKFKEVAEAYATLKDPEKRAAYDNLGQHRQGDDFVPPHQWQEHFHESSDDFSDVDLSDLLKAFAEAQREGAARYASRARHGETFEFTMPITLEQIYNGAETEISVAVPDYDSQGLLHRVPKTFRIRIPKGAADGQRLRLAGKGGQGMNGGAPGDLFVVMKLQPHKHFQVNGNDLMLEVPLTPWEAVLGASVEIPTLGGPVALTIPPGTVAGRKMRLSKRGLPGSGNVQGDLYAVITIEVPTSVSEREKTLYTELAAASSGFEPRRQRFAGGQS